MSVLDYGKEACGRVAPALDDYIAGELPADALAGVEAHLEICKSCSQELVVRRQILARLRNAHECESAPASLRASIQAEIGASSPHSPSLSHRPKLLWSGVLAAVVAVGGWTATSHFTGITPTGHLVSRVEIWTLLQQVSAVTGLGLGDHIYCAAFRNLDGDAVMAGKALMEVGDDQADLMVAVREVVPEHLRLRIAHRCEHQGREFVHFALIDGEELISVLATTRRDGESISAPMETDAAGKYQTAVFERGDYWTFVVSNLGGETNLQIAQSLRSALSATPQG